MTKSKTTRIRLRTRSIAAAAVLALGVGAAVPVIASASGAAPTQVTSTPENDGFTGLVKSPQLKQCAKNRKVIVLKQLGSAQNPKHRPEGPDNDGRRPPGRRLHVGHGQLRPHEGQVLCPREPDRVLPGGEQP